MITTDSALLAATILSGLLTLGYAVFRHDAPEPRRRVLKFWQEIFTICAVLLGVRVFYNLFPAVSPDKFFLGCAVLAGGFYAWFKVSRRNAPPEKRKVIRWCREAFLLLMFVFLFRGFYYDWFRIPSNSMLPTLMVGDLVLTDKNHYGYKLPIFNTRLSPGQPPARGDIIVFKKPDEELFFIKRIAGIPGDRIRYGSDKVLAINGESREMREYAGAEVAVAARQDADLYASLERRHLHLERGWHDIFIDRDSRQFLFHKPSQDHCSLAQSREGYVLNCVVPEGQYFVLGDNRDHSNDSRFWGFVPEENIVGPATRVIFNHRVITALEGERTDRFWLPLALRAELDGGADQDDADADASTR